MALTKYKFGELLELTNQKNSEGLYGESDAIGVNIDKIIQPMRGNISEKDFDKFHLVPPHHFAYNPRGSRKLGIGFNDTNRTYIITFNDNVFRIKDEAKDVILDTYLFMYLSRKEWDRYAEFISWGSSTEVFDWTYFCDEEILLPPIEIQKKYVAVYKALVSNRQSYERGIDDLIIVLEGYMDKLKSSLPLQSIGNYIELCEEKNEELFYGLDAVRGVSIDKKLIETKADMNGVSLRPYFILKPDEFAYVTVTSRNGEKISVAINDSDETYICSSSYVVFRSRDKDKLLPQYLMLFFSRSEFNRYVRFNSWGSARETFDWSEMCNVQIPIPDINIQRSIASIFNCFIERKTIEENLRIQAKNICSLLVKGAMDEARKEA